MDLEHTCAEVSFLFIHTAAADLVARLLQACREDSNSSSKQGEMSPNERKGNTHQERRELSRSI